MGKRSSRTNVLHGYQPKLFLSSINKVYNVGGLCGHFLGGSLIFLYGIVVAMCDLVHNAESIFHLH